MTRRSCLATRYSPYTKKGACSGTRQSVSALNANAFASSSKR